jgi:hypothetical protein
MKHIEKYNNFIRLNEDTRIIDNIIITGDIDDYDINIIKNSLIELEDLGWEILNIYKISHNTINVMLKIFTKRITNFINYSYSFNNDDQSNDEKVRIYNADYRTPTYSEYIKYEPTEYERNTINTIKDCTQTLSNMLEYNSGEILFYNKKHINGFCIKITLSKNETYRKI